jgi:hypothetical protein
MTAFTAKAAEFLELNVSLMVIDLFPPTERDPDGIHAAIWGGRAGNSSLPTVKPLTLVSYAAREQLEAYFEPVAVGQVLPEMPLFLAADRYMPLPLESTYCAAFETVDECWQRALTAPAN